MKITTGPYDATRRQIEATFVDNGQTHKRWVNACHDQNDAYDATATLVRLDAVAAGVKVKMALGVLDQVPTPDADNL